MFTLSYYIHIDVMVFLNVVFTSDGKLVEIQASSEADPFERTKMDMLLDLALEGTKGLFEKQMKAVNEA